MQEEEEMEEEEKRSKSKSRIRSGGGSRTGRMMRIRRHGAFQANRASCCVVAMGLEGTCQEHVFGQRDVMAFRLIVLGLAALTMYLLL